MPYKEFDLSGIGKVKIYKRRGNRTLRLTVAADGNVRVTMPQWAPYQAGVAFTLSRRMWILAQNKQDTGLLTHGLAVGKTHRLLFEQSALIDAVKTSVRSSEIIVTHRFDQTSDDDDVQAAARAACWRALRAQSKQLLGKRLAQLAEIHGFSYRSLNVKRMKSRWGSCDQHGNIVFNLFLVQLPWEYIDYVILHELTHTKALNHGSDFWELLEEHLPNARQLRHDMKSYRPALFVAPMPQAMA